MKKISAATEAKLLRAIDATAELINGGSSPNAAIVKVASEHGVTRSEIPLVVHAYNTGRTNRQRQDGDDVLTKSAHFELADADKIIAELYPTTVKTASAVHHATNVSSAYDAPPTAVLRNRNAMEKRARIANVRIQDGDVRTLNGDTLPEATTMPYEDGKHYLKAMSNLRAKHADAEEARRNMSNMFDGIGRSVTKLADCFVESNAPSYAVVKAAAQLRYGDDIKSVFDAVEIAQPSVTRGDRGAATAEKQAAFFDCTSHPFPLIDAVLSSVAAYNTAREKFAATVTDYQKTASAVELPLEPAISASIHADDSIFAEPIEKVAMGLNNPVQMMGAYSIMDKALGAINRMRGPDDPARVNRLVSQLNDPNHEQQLRLINTHGMLTDLMSHDPVISGYDPADVTDAFSEISQISPSVSDQRSIMQGLLRKRLAQGGLDSFEHGQLLDFEQKLRQQATPMAGGATNG